MNHIKDKIEAFVALATIDSQDLANRISAALEDMGVPIILEHVDLEQDEHGFRISTQAQYFENASRIVDNHLSVHSMKKNVTVRDDAFN